MLLMLRRNTRSDVGRWLAGCSKSAEVVVGDCRLLLTFTDGRWFVAGSLER